MGSTGELHIAKVIPTLGKVLVVLVHISIVGRGAPAVKFYSAKLLSEVGHILDPVFIESSRVVISTNGTITLAKESNKVAFTTCFDPAIIVLLNSSSTPPSLVTVSRLALIVDDTILIFLSILSIPNSSNNRSKFSATLRTNVYLDSIPIKVCISPAIFISNRRVSIRKDRRAKNERKKKPHRQSSQSM